jgi:quinol monooxygenase YgiN
MSDLVYVSITGLQLKNIWHAPVFWRHATASMSQAQKAKGCLSADARSIEGVHHTLSVWISREAMLDYLTKGTHLNAMKTFKKIATGKVHGYETTTIPDWQDVHKLWCEHGRSV